MKRWKYGMRVEMASGRRRRRRRRRRRVRVRTQGAAAIATDRRERESKVGTNKRRQFWSVHHGAMTAVSAAAAAAAVLKKIALTRVAVGS